MRARPFTVILEPEAQGRYSVHCPALPGCVSQGETRQAALENIKEAITLVLETLEQDALVQARGVGALASGHLHPAESPEVIGREITEILKGRLEDGLPLTIETVEVRVAVASPA